MRVLLEGSGLHAPDLVLLEVAGSLRNRVIRKEIDASRALEAVARLRRLPISRHPVLPLIDRVWELRDNLTRYGAAYAALAERLKVPLATADQRLATAPGLRW
jgi:predicted nucleic acid-binding protein